MLEKKDRWPRISLGRTSVSKATYLAAPVGSKRSSSFFTGKPIQGITIDHASTQRRR